MKQMICTICGLIGSSVAAFFGGWTSGMTTLLILMCIDYVTGLMVAGIFKKSKKQRVVRQNLMRGGKDYAGKVLPYLLYWWLVGWI